MQAISFSDQFGDIEAVRNGRKTMVRSHRFYEVGQTLAIKECYETIFDRLRRERGDAPAVQFLVRVLKAHGKDPHNISAVRKLAGWKKKAFALSELMPAAPCIVITGRKIERLQDISDEDCIQEGIMKEELPNEQGQFYVISHLRGKVQRIAYPTPREVYASVTKRIHGREAWCANKIRYAYTFQYVSA